MQKMDYCEHDTCANFKWRHFKYCREHTFVVIDEGAIAVYVFTPESPDPVENRNVIIPSKVAEEKSDV